MSVVGQKPVTAPLPLARKLTPRPATAHSSFWRRLSAFFQRLVRERPAWLRFAAAISVLAVEVVIFTLLFEFKTGPMRVVANSIGLTGSVVGVVGFAMISSQRRVSVDLPKLRRAKATTFLWVIAHSIVILAFFYFTKTLQASAGRGTGWGTSLAWLALAAIVAGSILLAALPARWIAAYLRQSALATLGATVVALLMIFLTPAARSLWFTANGPALQIIRYLLEWFPGSVSISYLGTSHPVPLVATSNIPLVITQHCSEMESMLAFGLLGALLLATGGRRMWSLYFLGPFLIGFELLYALNAVRLYLLLLMGHVMAETTWAKYASGACVSLAHSRVGSFLLLAVAVLILLVGERLSRREWLLPVAADKPA